MQEERERQLQRLRELDAEAASLRRKLGLNTVNEIVWYGESVDDEYVEVRADGYDNFFVGRYRHEGCCRHVIEERGPFTTLYEASELAAHLLDGEEITDTDND